MQLKNLEGLDAQQCALIFDKDGVIGDYDYQALDRFFKKCSGHNAQEVTHELSHFARNADYSKLSKDEAEIVLWKDFCDDFIKRYSKQLQDTRMLREFNHLDYWRPFSEVETVLREVKEMGVIVGVLTENPMANIQKALSMLSLENYVDYTDTSLAYSNTKAEETIFQQFLQAMNVELSTCISLEHSIFIDNKVDHVIAARKAGLGASIHLDRKSLDHNLETGVIANLTAILDILP